mmetsp:Transcript_6421/g.9006  ORF Transcript_6421/g.9006 Transcript_6421/m.9006 type:complete len:136 (-) Transcript_6421:133-540(-)
MAMHETGLLQGEMENFERFFFDVGDQNPSYASSTEMDEAMYYENLLELENLNGNVREDRWKLQSSAIISQLPRTTFEERTTEAITSWKCLICMHEYNRGDVLMDLPCSHSYHAECIVGWLHSKDYCPLCKHCITS